MADNLLEKASILLTPTAYDNGRMLSAKPNKNLYGSELVTNGDFSQGSQDWTFNTNGNNQWSVANEKASYLGTATDFIITNNVLTIGKKYLVSFDILDTNGSTIRLSVTSEVGGAFDNYTNGDGKYTTYLTANTNYLRIGASSSGASFSIDNVSVVEDLTGDFTFSRSSAATRVNAQGLVEEITDTDLPRIDYTDGCGSWLLEPQSTNLIAQSEALSTIVSQSTITDNNLASPTGDVNASLVVENTATNSHGIKKSNIIPTNENAVDYTISVFAKKKERQFVQLQLYADSTQYNSSIFNLNDGTTTGNSSTHKIEDYGNGWYRCSFTDSVTQSTGGFNFAAAYMSQSLTSYYTGDGASGIYMFGFQFEQQSYATSYILTNGAIATRLADVATNSGNSTLINSTEGVLYAEIAYLNDTGTYRTISINDGSNNNMVAFENRPTSNQIKAFVNVLGVNVMNSTQTLSNVKEFNKVAIKWKQNDFAWWVNGVKIYEDLSGSTFGSGVLNKVNFNNGAINFPFEGKVKALAVYKEALTDAQLQSLTTT